MSKVLTLNQLQLDESSLSLSLQAKIDFEQFADFAEPLASALDCRVLERQWGADRHQWLLEFEGSQIQLHYEFYGDVCWLSAQQNEFDVLEYFFKVLQTYLLK